MADYDNGATQNDPEAQEMLRSFVSEAFDSLDTNEPIVEDLREEGNSESVNGIFRVFHTLKGLSGFFGMKVIHKVTHEAETLLDVIRKQDKPQTEATITIVYQTFDFLRDLLQRVNAELTDLSGAEEAEDMKLVLKDTLAIVSGEKQAEEDDEDLAGFFAPEAEVSAPAVAEPESSPEPEPEPESSPDQFISGDMLDQYLVNSQELIDVCEKNLLELENDPKNEGLVGETFGMIHSIKGNSGFMGFGEIEEVSSEMETILDCVRQKELDIDQNLVTILLSNVEVVRDRLQKIAKGVEKESHGTQEEVHHAAPEPTSPPKAEPAKVEQPKEEAVKPAAEVPKAEPAKAESKTPPAKADAKADAKAAPTKKKAIVPQIQRKDIRVETIKIDKLFDLVGELITIESMVTNSADLKGLNLPNFSKSARMLNKITRELQGISMSIRMMPLEGLFNKMKRLVRDVSIKMKKKVNLIVKGQETEMDKNVIDEIADPLVHILRNAIDHGVEIPAIRAEAGKQETGTVKLSARYEGNEILILVEDDGAGIDRDVILAKAEEKGILKVAPETMSDRDVFALIFEPGFSTAAVVTDISGRGVGMDVVKKNIEKLKGRVTIDSVLGRGSRFTLRIPLTLAIMEAMVIRIGDAKFALPLLAVKESFRPDMNNISNTMDGLEVVRVREDVLPIYRLHELFNREPSTRLIEEGILIIIEYREKQVCVFADEIVGQQQAVIKGLSGYIGKVTGITGCMILGDGEIGLIIDIEGIVEMAQKTNEKLLV
jgi:two-component system, chemotaxis family, sensor kinase CheA